MSLAAPWQVGLHGQTPHSRFAAFGISIRDSSYLLAMEFRIPPPELVPFGLRALKAVASANGQFDERERALLDAAQRLFGTNHNLDRLSSITPTELAAAVSEPALRKQLLYGMLMMSMADGEASEAEADVVEGYREALGVDMHEVQTFRKLSEGHLMSARLDVVRRFWARERILEEAEKNGIGWLLRGIGTLAGIATDDALAAKYRSLENYPVGSLGREYFDFIRENEFSFPGEKGSPPEVIILHDLTHVLGDYGTDPTGEIQVTAFHAGYRRKDPFTWILFSMMQFNMGIRMTPLAQSAELQFDPPKVLDAIRRGAAMNADLTDGTWNYWADMDQPLAEVRKKFGIPPKQVE